MNIISVRSLQYANAEGTAINMFLKVDKIIQEVPFTAMPNDSASYGRELYDRAINGELGPIEPYVEPEETE